MEGREALRSVEATNRRQLQPSAIKKKGVGRTFPHGQSEERGEKRSRKRGIAKKGKQRARTGVAVHRTTLEERQKIHNRSALSTGEDLLKDSEAGG